MLFNSIEFFIFLPVVFIVYYSISSKYRPIILLIASYFFYAYLKPEYIFVLILVTLINYFSTILISKIETKKRKIYFIICVFLNLAILFGFKYLNFIFGILNYISLYTTSKIIFPNILLEIPAGISFYIFIALGYTIDVYRYTYDAEKNFAKISLLISFFPIILSGPIERANKLLPQFKNDIQFNYKNVTDGMKLFAWGLFKKTVISDRLSIFVDAIYNNPRNFKGIFLIIATIFYAFQIYCDFSGYTDMALGSAKILGYKLSNNFRRPYYSKSISEFWRRWHITLSEWLRDYVFLPIAYSLARKSKSGKLFLIKTESASYYCATIITMLLIGLWHGANWNFIIWGLLFSFFMVFSRITNKPRKKILKYLKLYKFPMLLKFIRVSFTFFLVCFCWVFFRANSFEDAFYIITNSFYDITLIFNEAYILKNFTVIGLSYNSMFISVLLLSLLEYTHFLQRKGSIINMLSRKPIFIRWSIYLIFLMILIFFSNTFKQKFIYLNF